MKTAWQIRCLWRAWMAAAWACLLPVQAGLVAHFPLEEGLENLLTNRVHSTVGGWTGTLFGSLRNWPTSGLAPVPTGTQAALYLEGSFPGIDPHVYTTCLGVLGDGARTVSAWIRGTMPQADLGVLVSWGRNEKASRYTFRIETASGVNQGKLRLEASGQAIIGETPVLDGEWHHVAVVTPAGGSTHDSRLYVDGVPEGKILIGTAVRLETKVNPLEPRELLYIGNGGWQTSDYGFTGAIDDVRLYDEALGEDQIRELASRPGDQPRFVRALPDASLVLGDPEAVVRFRAAVTGRGPLTYVWRFRGLVLPGQTGPELVIRGAQPGITGEYRVTASNAAGSAGDSAVLRLTTGPVEPVQQTVLAGGGATFKVLMPAVEGYRYEWEKDGTVIPEAQGATLSRINLKLEDAGLYRVRVTLGGHTVVSEPVVLQVLQTPPSTYSGTVLRDGPEAYWRLNERNGSAVAKDVAGFHDANYFQFGSAGLEIPGALLQEPDTAAQFDPDRINYVERTLDETLNDVRQFSVEIWVQPVLGSEYALVTALANLPSQGYQLLLTAGGDVRFRSGASSNPAARNFDDLTAGRVQDGAWNHVVATYDGRTKRLFVNGTLVGEQTVPILPSPGLFLRLGAGNGPGTLPGNVLRGNLDEVAYYRKPLDSTRVLTHYVTAGRSQAGVMVFYRAGTDLMLLWADPSAILESSPAMEGPWGPIAGATSPYAVTAGQAGQAYYRLRQVQ